MQPYQEEYIANLKEIAGSVPRGEREGFSFDAYFVRNMKLLREELFPLLDHIYDAEEEKLAELREFAGKLLSGREELDVGLFCQIHKALLSLARLKKNRGDMIRELYWLGMGYYSLCNRLVGLENGEAMKYTTQMRLCFTEAAAYLKYFDEIEDVETRGYILRSRANMSLGHFQVPSEKIHMVKRSLQIFQDQEYRAKEPGLPWDRFLYMTHQQMAASVSYGRENTMTPEDAEAVMESVYIVHQRRAQEAEERGEKLPLRPRYSRYVIDHYCGMYGMDELLSRLEALMDEADVSDFTEAGMYGVISIPAFYCQFLNYYPEKIPVREEYIGSLYRKALGYVDAFPRASENEALFLYLRQLSCTFVETAGSVSYKDFLIRLQIHFAPEIYVHSRIVAEAAVALCGILLEEEPGFFDDIALIRETTDLGEKRRRLLAYAMDCGMLYDVGKMSFMALYSHVGRQWFEEEYAMARLHTVMGSTWLEGRRSTSAYAPVALGHHSWYDGSREGYPESYRRLECPCRQMVDIIGLFDWINNVSDTAKLYKGMEKTFEEAVEAAVALEGRRFSPLLTARLRDREIVLRIREAFAEGRREAFRQIGESNGTKKTAR